MVNYIDKKLLISQAEKFGVILNEEAAEKFDYYARLLVSWNEKINLTAITEPNDIVIKHFVDSLALFRFVKMPVDSKIIDVGTGAGFPGVALLIARPDLKITLLDGTAKKLNVIENILSEIGLEADILHARAEEAGRKTDYREKFDFATARAVANLRELSEYCLPFVKKNGYFISLKGAKAQDEINDAKKAVHILGGKIEKKEQFPLDEAGERNIIIIKKISQTPTKYPRPSAKIAKAPLI